MHVICQLMLHSRRRGGGLSLPSPQRRFAKCRAHTGAIDMQTTGGAMKAEYQSEIAAHQATAAVLADARTASTVNAAEIARLQQLTRELRASETQLKVMV